MTARSRYGVLVVLAVACVGGGCRVRLERPDTVPIRMIEPRLVEPAEVVADAPNAISVRLLETQGRGHIGRRVLHLQPDGEVTEDPVWLWTSTPDRYVDSAVRYAIASSPDIRLVDLRGAPSLAVTLRGMADRNGAELTAGRGSRGPGDDVRRAVHSEMIRAEEPIAADLPGDLAAAAGRLLHRLAVRRSGLRDALLSEPAPAMRNRDALESCSASRNAAATCGRAARASLVGPVGWLDRNGSIQAGVHDEALRRISDVIERITGDECDGGRGPGLEHVDAFRTHDFNLRPRRMSRAPPASSARPRRPRRCP